MSEILVRWVKGLCMGWNCPEKATIQLINASGMSSDECAECVLRGNTDGLKIRPYPRKMSIGEREPFMSGIQASQPFETYDRFINGARYRFVVHFEWYDRRKRVGVQVSRVVGIDDGGSPILEPMHQFGKPITRWGF
ncbi:hypothetical protein ACIPYS_17685 [Kitasatospora sp. NPDC089913]|uniref:hypothetical protein n=1 Tax=Kitasatospora sp. NPDC089913 TaxID=3364080 RepID=UPI0038117CF5